MKAVAINSIFIILSSTVITTGGLVLSHNSEIFVRSDNAAIVVNSRNLSQDTKESVGFTSFEEIINTSLLNVKDATSTKSELINIESNASLRTKEVITESSPPPENLGESIVNIVCLQVTDKYKRRISGTGFFISSRGVILTNAHLGQFLLLVGLEDFGKTTCSATTGKDNAPTYNVKLLYISPTWLIEHANLITDPSPRGTGENDFALLFVQQKDNQEEVTGNFPHLPPHTGQLTNNLKDDTVILVGYPKEDGAKIGKRTVATTTVTNLYTFGSGFADIMSLDSSPLGYTGASGGPVIDHTVRSIAVITTKESGTTILNAITIEHIDRSIKEETGNDLITTLQGNLDHRATIFNETISPILQQILIKTND